MALSAQNLSEYTNSKERRHTFFSYLCTEYVGENAVFILLVKQYIAAPSKGKAQFIDTWFINPQRVTSSVVDVGGGGDLGSNSLVTSINVSAVGSNYKNYKSALNTLLSQRTFSQKMTHQGGGVGGFFSALGQKLAGSVKASPGLLDALVEEVRGLLDVNQQLFSGYSKDKKYQIPGSYTKAINQLSLVLTANHFNPDDAGIYGG